MVKPKPIVLYGENVTHPDHPIDRTSGDCDVLFRVPEGWTYFIKKIEVHHGPDVRIEDIRLDGVSTEQRSSFDSVDVFGDSLAVDNYIVVQASNTGRDRHGITVKAYGVKVQEEVANVAE